MIYQGIMNKKKINIGIIGLGQIGSRLYKEILSKKNDIKIKTGTSINILAISTSEIKLSVIIDEDDTLNAVKKLHTVFNLD